MPITLVPGEVDRWGAGAASTMNFTNISPVAGNLLVVVGANNVCAIWPAGTGLTKLAGARSGSYIDGVIYYKILDGTETGISLGPMTGSETVKAFHYTGNAASDVLDDWGDDNANASTAGSKNCYSGSAIATEIGGLALFAAISRDQRFVEAATLTASDSFTAVSVVSNASLGISTNNPGVEVWSKDISATGVYSCTQTTTDTGDENVGMIALFKAIPSGPPVTLSNPTTIDITSIGVTLRCDWEFP